MTHVLGAIRIILLVSVIRVIQVLLAVNAMMTTQRLNNSLALSALKEQETSFRFL